MIELYTANTPNGYKASVTLEEMSLEYNVHPINLGELEQKEPWYVKINPNGRIPAIIDKDNGDFTVFESGAIMLYLAEKTGQLLGKNANDRSRIIQWLMFQMGGVGPMQGQAHVFFRYAPERIPYAIERYQKETKRLYTVLNTQLDGRDYLVDDYSIADIANFTWVRSHEWAGVDINDLPHLKSWLARIEERPAVQRGLAVPPKNEESETEQVEKAKKMV